MRLNIIIWQRQTLLLVTAGGLGCASPSGGAPSRGDRVENVSIESQTSTQSITLRPDVYVASASMEFPANKVWEALPTAYNALPIPIEAVDSAHRFILGSGQAYRQFLRSPVSRFVDCGSTIVGPSADSYNVRLRIQTHVDSVTASTSDLRTQVEATGSSSGGAVRCTSNGVLERMISDQVKELLGARK